MMALAALLGAGAAYADEDLGEDERQLGPSDAAPLAHLLAHIHGRFPGEVLRVEMERELLAGRRIWVYEIKLLTPEGDVIKLFFDARNLDLIKSRGHGRYAENDDDDYRNGHREDD